MHIFGALPAGFFKVGLPKSERGAALVEYALLLVLIAIVCMLAISTLGEQAENEFMTVGASIAAAG